MHHEELIEQEKASVVSKRQHPHGGNCRQACELKDGLGLLRSVRSSCPDWFHQWEQNQPMTISDMEYTRNLLTNVFNSKELFKCILLTTVQGNRVVFSIFYSEFIDKQFMTVTKSQDFCLPCL